MEYTIGEVAKIMNLSVPTLRYYDKEGLLPLLKRTERGIRRFNDNDISWLNMIECLKNTGMQIKDIKTFFEWCVEGDSTIEKRYKMFLERKVEAEKRIEILQKSLDLINFKCNYYKTAFEAGTTDIPELQQACSESNAPTNHHLFKAVVCKEY
ncbi:MerR family transcriptional regulator [Clostridium beijerinckii]|uniref:MerR family transcriptional regulator n=1 Tax=Clostridium beijerinckii TaxID=1520 RepID=A0A0B5QTP3_CLOBE|nr:MerR family transcriptional regulator [Clostridium beijerinckii]AJH00224.1 MerR family transcriptional regulator [Clostridium beijerinckii]